MTLRELILKVTNNNSLDIYLGQYDELDHQLYIDTDEYINGCNMINFAHLDEDGDIILQLD